MELEKSGDKAIIAWLKETAQRGYSNDKIKEVLSSSGYDIKAVQAVLALREELKRKKKLFVRKEAEAEDKRLSKDPANIPEEIREVYELLSLTREEVGKVVLGQRDVVDAFMCALLCNGHVLLEGVPGIAKTLLVRVLAEASGCSSNRIQFTVDLLPSDILGMVTYTPEKGFETIKGPIFANFIIADEINRSPPKCVLGETPIITESGEIKAIKEIFEEYKGKKALSENNEEWLELKSPIKLMSLDLGDYKIKPEPVKYLYRQKTNKPYHNVVLKTGREIQTSTEHPFFTLKDGKIEMIKASELKRGECVLIPRELNLESDNILKYDEKLLEESEQVIKEIERRKDLYSKIEALKSKGMKVGEIKKKLMVDDYDKQLLLTFINSKPRYLEIENPKDYYFSNSKQFGQVSFVKKPVAVTEELARFMAILISEGSVNGSYFYLTMKEQEVPIQFIQDAERALGIKAKLLYDGKRQQYRVAFRSDALKKLLFALGYDSRARSGSKKIPGFIMKASKDIIKEFLKTYYEGDGCVSRDCVKVTTKSKSIANSLSYLLLRMGLVAKIGNELAKTNIGKYHYLRKFYNLRLYGAELSSFYESVGFLTEEKNSKLRNLIKSTEKLKTDLIPGIHGLIRNLRKTLGITHKRFYELTGMNAHNLENPGNALAISRSRLSRITGALTTENVLVSQLKRILGGEFYCDAVKSNTQTNPEKDYYLYDFSMNEKHSFIAGFGGIISHNTQSAMIEAMQERQVTISKKTYPLPNPFFVMANNNPLESSGVYNLPEAQVDRFLFKVIMGYPKKGEEVKIIEDNMTLRDFSSFNVKPILSAEKILEMQAITKNKIYMDDKVKNYIVEIVEKTRKKDFEHGKYIEWGGSPRASIGLFIAAKAWALMNGRNYAIPQDVKDIAHYVLRHRIILNYRARAEGITSDTIVDEILKMINV